MCFVAGVRQSPPVGQDCGFGSAFVAALRSADYVPAGGLGPARKCPNAHLGDRRFVVGDRAGLTGGAAALYADRAAGLRSVAVLGATHRHPSGPKEASLDGPCRNWIELGFRCVKTVSWKWHKTRRQKPTRVGRHWLVLAVSTLLAGSLAPTQKAVIPPRGHSLL